VAHQGTIVAGEIDSVSRHEKMKIPTIGIGAGHDVDGQVLVLHDMLGITQKFSPRFLRRYHNLYEEIRGSVMSYIGDVKTADFPNDREQY